MQRAAATSIIAAVVVLQSQSESTRPIRIRPAAARDLIILLKRTVTHQGSVQENLRRNRHLQSVRGW